MAEDRLPERASEEKNLSADGELSAPGNDSIVQSASLFLLARRILLTSLGAIALTFEETNDFIERLIERGELAEHELAALVEDTTNRGKNVLNYLPDLSQRTPAKEKSPPALEVHPLQNGASHALAKPGAIGERVEGILGRLNVPSRNDIETLTRKIDLLSGKLLLLKSKPPAPPIAVDENAETAETA